MITRGVIRFLAYAALLAPAPARPQGRTDWRAVAELLAAGLIAPGAPEENGYYLAGRAIEWVSIPRDVLAQLARVASIDAARVILGLFGGIAIFSENGTSPPENGTSAPKSGTRVSENGSPHNDVVVAFRNRKSESNNSSEGLLREIGVEAVVARRLAMQYSDIRLREVLAAAGKAKDPAAWIVSALRRDFVVARPSKSPATPTVKPAATPIPKQLWPAWREVICALREELQPQLRLQMESVHAVCSGTSLQLLCANRMAAAQLLTSLPAIEQAVAKVDAHLRVVIDVGSAYAA